MAVCCVRDLCIGEGKPKICLPIVGKNDKDIFKQAKSFENLKYDLVELRIDFYEDIDKNDKVVTLLNGLREIFQCPILFTYRSLREGGNIQLTNQEYVELIKTVCETHLIDIVDIELMSGNEVVFQLIEIAHQNQVKVIMSNHDFDKTPTLLEMKERLEKMEILGGDILKIAVMPNSKKDVLDLLHLTMEMSGKLNKPLVTMSMGQMGVISRICGELTGSAITFASAGKASAPGQIAVEDMNVLLEALHHD